MPMKMSAPATDLPSFFHGMADSHNKKFLVTPSFAFTYFSIPLSPFGERPPLEIAFSTLNEHYDSAHPLKGTRCVQL